MQNQNQYPVVYQPSAKPGIAPQKLLLLAMSAGVAVGAGFLIHEYMVSKKDAAFVNPSSDKTKPKSTPTPKASPSPSSGFPLKKGSSGAKVMQLQTAISKIIGSAAMTANGGIDGKFGPGTENALKQAGYGTVIDEATFNTITGGTGAKTGKNTIAQAIYDAAESANINATITALKRINTVQEYTIADEQYKTLTKSKDLVRKTIVNDLLSYAFADNDTAKDKIKQEFLRIGLKLNKSTGVWSLEGLNPPGTIITLVPTFIIDNEGKALLIGRNVILGRMILVKNGYTWFQSIDNAMAAVPSSNIKYL